MFIIIKAERCGKHKFEIKLLNKSFLEMKKKTSTIMMEFKKKCLPLLETTGVHVNDVSLNSIGI